MTVLRTGLKGGLALLALGLAVTASPDQSQDADFIKDEIAYIKKYAWPKRIQTNERELLFSQRASVPRTVENSGQSNKSKDLVPTSKDPAPSSPSESPTDHD